jgi:L-aminopeptidase/D-esterase-like protein
MATGTREIEVLSPFHLVDEVNAVLLTGGSAFGLAAADGVMGWLSERGEGFETGAGTVPLVPSAVLFDLQVGVPRPGPEEGRRAAEDASSEPVREGRVGAGAGATVGKLLGSEQSSPGGVGSTSREWGGGTVGAMAVVNALGDVVGKDGRILAGARGRSGSPLGSDSVALQGGNSRPGWPGANTTLAVIATDLALSRVDLAKLAAMASTSFPRAITPVHTPFDGDLLFALSTGRPEAAISSGDLMALGVVARKLTEGAIRRAVTAGGGGSSETRGDEPS